MAEATSDILVIGAGMAGLTCANVLANAGHDVAIVDKGRGPGGRMATRRAEVGDDVVSFDHGAQYFTARDANFRKVVARWQAIGVVAPWGMAGDDAFVGTPGMNGPIRALAEGLPDIGRVRWKTRALTLAREGGIWRVDTCENSIVARMVLIAIPAEQARELLEHAAPELAAIAGAVRSQPCWTVMASFASRLELPNTIRSTDDAVSWAARNSAKPERRGTECWVIQASPSRSQELLEMAKDEVAQTLMADFFAQTGSACVAPSHLTAHRWLYAKPSAIEGEPARYDAKARIGIAGDYLHSPRVEGAWLSGCALAEKVLAKV